MNAKKSTCALSLAVALAAAAVPALAKAPAQEKKNAAVAEDAASTRTIVGTLSDLKPGHSFAVMKADRSVEPFDLEDKEFTFNLGPDVKKGSPVVVTESVQADGRHVVTVASKK